MIGLARWVAIGASYDHATLGHELTTTADQQGSIDINRGVHALWGRLRIYPARNEVIGVYVSLAPGLAWQTANASIALPAGPLAARPNSTSCSATDSASFAMSAGLGVEVAAGGGFVLTGETSFDDYRFGAGSFGDCGAPGAGTTGTFGARIGLGYRFDLGGKPKAEAPEPVEADPMHHQ
jgi:hypothetical protein